MSNKKLNSARKAKKDEFYTSYKDIEIECKNYIQHFKDKVIYCNCDNPYESNFFKYFVDNFNNFGLKKLIATCYNGCDDIVKQSLFDTATETNLKAYYIEITEVNTDIDTLIEKNIQILKGNGDFRSKECTDILDTTDIVVTNPPFSLFKDFINILTQYNKQFLIIGNIVAITNASIFSLVRDNKIWLGKSIHSGDREFRVPNDYPLESSTYRVDENGVKYINVTGVRWYTNLTYENQYSKLELKCTYTPEQYPKYDGFDAIEVSETKYIPKNYYGIMGVPITYYDKYNPSEFKIIGLTNLKETIGIPYTDCYAKINGEEKYRRLLIKRLDKT